jgi:hypothetical protein
MKNQPIILISIVLIVLTFGACTKYTSRIKGQGPIVQQTVDMPSISAVSLSIDANVVLTRGDSQSVKIEGQQNIINNIEKYVSDEGLWRIGYYNSVKNHAGVKIYITSPGIDFATISGSGNIKTTNHFPDNTHVYLQISGSGNIHFSTDADIVESGISGSGQIFLDGTTYEHSINISGSGNVKAFGLTTENTIARVSGSGNSEVFVQDYLNATISGSGSIFYKGNPEIEANISGSGTIINRN